MLTPIKRVLDDAGYHYSYVAVRFDRVRRFATITVSAPVDAPSADAAAILAQGADFWPLAMARELDDAILMLRTNEPELGLFFTKIERRPRRSRTFLSATA